MGFLDFLFRNKIDKIKDFQDRGAIIIDVRTANEYAQGAIEGSINYPLQTIGSNIEKIRRTNKPVITCCASGIRSGNAANILKNKGIEVINGGGWVSLSRKIQF